MATENDPNIPAEKPEEETFGPTPKSLTFRYLAILWILPSLGAIWILLGQMDRVQAGTGLSGKLAVVSIEQWLAVVLLLLHLAFVGLTRHYRQKEKTAEGSGS